jgi:phosphatidylserine/phosphatidylglycerophosphate/cardiolipin synthase-like enzyme
MILSPRTLVAAWELVKSAGLDIFRPGVLAQLSSIPGWSALGLGSSSARGGETVSLLDALRALALRERAVASTSSVELVATLPLQDRTILATPDVVRTLLDGARRSILVIGFEITDPAMRSLLFRRGLDQIEITVVGDRQRASSRELLKDWPAAARPLRALENVEPTTHAHTFLHAKVIVVDGETALIGSANFTVGGLRSNLEMGVRVTGNVVDDVLRTVTRLESEGWIVPAHP